MVQSYVSNTHEMLVPPVYTPADRHPGVMETLKTFTRLILWAEWRGGTYANDSSKKQIETGGMIKVKPFAMEKRGWRTLLILIRSLSLPA